MTSVPEDDDDRAATLLGWLVEQGYAPAEASGGVEGGDRRVRMVRGACQVSVIRDRGQWFVEAGPLDADSFDMNLWEAHLRDVQPSVEPAEFAEEERMLRNILHEIERTLVLDDDAVSRLDALRTWRNDTRWSSPHAL